MSGAGAMLAILASAIVVFGGLWRLTRAIWRAAQDLRDNKAATQANTGAIVDLKSVMDGRLTGLEQRIADVERRLPLRQNRTLTSRYKASMPGSTVTGSAARSHAPTSGVMVSVCTSSSLGESGGPRDLGRSEPGACLRREGKNPTLIGT